MTKTQDPRAKLTADLRRWVAEYDALQSKAGALKARIFAHTYEWVRWTIENGQAADVKAACIRLGNTIKRSYKNVESWYYCGDYMARNKLDAKTTDHRSVRAVYMRRKTLSRADSLRALDMIRKGKDHTEVKRLVDNSASSATAASDKKAARLEKKGELTAQRVKLETHAFLTFVSRYFRKHKPSTSVEVVVYVDGEEKVRVSS